MYVFVPLVITLLVAPNKLFAAFPCEVTFAASNNAKTYEKQEGEGKLAFRFEATEIEKLPNSVILELVDMGRIERLLNTVVYLRDSLPGVSTNFDFRIFLEAEGNKSYISLQMLRWPPGLWDGLRGFITSYRREITDVQGSTNIIQAILRIAEFDMINANPNTALKTQANATLARSMNDIAPPGTQAAIAWSEIQAKIVDPAFLKIDQIVFDRLLKPVQIALSRNLARSELSVLEIQGQDMPRTHEMNQANGSARRWRTSELALLFRAAVETNISLREGIWQHLQTSIPHVRWVSGLQSDQPFVRESARRAYAAERNGGFTGLSLGDPRIDDVDRTFATTAAGLLGGQQGN